MSTFVYPSTVTLSNDGWDKWVISLNPPVFFGTKSMGEHLRFEIGQIWNGPATRPISISLWTFSKTSDGCWNTDFKFLIQQQFVDPYNVS